MKWAVAILLLRYWVSVSATAGDQIRVVLLMRAKVHNDCEKGKRQEI